MTLLFDLLSLVYVFRAVQVARVAWQQRAGLSQGALKPHYKRLADQSSFYLAVPVGVFIHELGHALAVWLFGGRVLEFGYRAFWGFVVPSGNFSPAEDWFISLAGTLGSLIFGLGTWLLFRRHRAPAFRYFGLRTLRFQLYFALFYYPIFTLLGFYGDWRTIYDFNATPLLSGITAAGHALIVGATLLADRRGWFEMAAVASTEAQDSLTSLEESAAANPQDPQLQLQVIDAYRQGGMVNKGLREVKRFLADNPDSAAGYLQQALLQVQGKPQIPPAARDSATRALSLGLANPASAAVAHQILGSFNLDMGKIREAVDHFDRGFSAARSADRPELAAFMIYLRALAYRRERRYESAYQDIRQAITLAQNAGDEPGLARYRQEQETIERHAGRSLGGL